VQSTLAMPSNPLVGICLAPALLVAAAGHAHADETNLQIAASTLESAAQKTERAIAIGPTVGVGSSYSFHPGGYQVPLSFGLELTWFDVPLLPDAGDLYDQVMEQAKDRALARAKQMVEEGKPAPTQEELEQMAREMFDQVKAEVRRGLAYQPHLVEDPSFRLALEGAYVPGDDFWQVRLTGGIGIAMFSVGPTAVVHFGNGTGVSVGGEVDLHLMPSASVRSPVIDLYVRGDFGIKDDGADADTVGVGARFQLDLI
jgi:hypothetical protein